jgi:hypothetical protein
MRLFPHPPSPLPLRCRVFPGSRPNALVPSSPQPPSPSRGAGGAAANSAP